jgi:hypothetical protein
MVFSETINGRTWARPGIYIYIYIYNFPLSCWQQNES